MSEQSNIRSFYVGEAIGEHDPTVKALRESSHQEADGGAPGVDGIRNFMREMGSYRLLDHEESIHYAKTYRAGVAADELLGSGESLTDHEKDLLSQAAADGTQAKEILITANIRLVVGSARQYWRSKEIQDLQDYINEGMIGLNRAVEKFRPELGYRFSTYATWWIKQSMQRHQANATRTVRIPYHIQEQIYAVKRHREKLIVEIGREPTLVEVAERLGQSLSDVNYLLSLNNSVSSLDAKNNGDYRALQEVIADRQAEISFGEVEDSEIISMLEKVAYEVLPDARDWDILQLRYGLRTGKPETLESIGRILGITRERVRQLEAKALKRLREALRGQDIHDYNDMAS